jgi:hypothetical protein
MDVLEGQMTHSNHKTWSFFVKQLFAMELVMERQKESYRHSPGLSKKLQANDCNTPVAHISKNLQLRIIDTWFSYDLYVQNFYLVN